MKIAVITDAWHPQVNGVVRTLDQTRHQLERLGHQTVFVTPQDFTTYPCPTYPSIRLALFPKKRIERTLSQFKPHAVHIATEGPLGYSAGSLCFQSGIPFTTSFHTQFPEYIRARIPFPVSWSYGYLRRYHSRAIRTFVATPSLRKRLHDLGFNNLEIWSRGVDTSVFMPGPKTYFSTPRPISLYMGRVAIEKNIEAFLELDLPGSKYVVGEGPDLRYLQSKYRDVHFVGQKLGKDLVAHVSAADVFVFPSLTDTFGLVLLEAMACGVPVAAYPVTGPIDVVQNGKTGVLDTDLRRAIFRALNLDPADCIAYARKHSWEQWTKRFVSLLEPIDEGRWPLN